MGYPILTSVQEMSQYSILGLVFQGVFILNIYCFACDSLLKNIQAIFGSINKIMDLARESTYINSLCRRFIITEEKVQKFFDVHTC